MMESDNKLRQAIKSFLTTFYEVRRLVDFIEELPVRHEMKLLSYDNMTASKLTPTDVENLYRRLTHSTLTEDINNGIMDDFPDEQTITNRLKHLKYSISREDVFKIEDVDSAYGAEIPTTKILSEVMDYGEAYDYTNTVWGIYREWNLIVDCLKRVITDIENEFLNPQPDTTTEQEQMIRQTSILEDAEIKAVMQAVEGIGLMVQKDCWYYWTGDNALLSYLCSEISRYKEYSKQMREDEYLPNWIKFEGIFKAKGRKKDEWVEVDSNRLANYKKQYKKYHQRFSPDGCKDIDEIIERCIKI